MAVTIRGASDDLIEVEGDVTAEFCTDADGDGRHLVFSDGTVLHVEYTDAGMWRINRTIAGKASYSKVEATSSEGKDYSDVVTLGVGPHGFVTFDWVVCGEIVARKKQ